MDGDWEGSLSSIGVAAEVENAITKECYCNIYYDDVLSWQLDSDVRVIITEFRCIANKDVYWGKYDADSVVYAC